MMKFSIASLVTAGLVLAAGCAEDHPAARLQTVEDAEAVHSVCSLPEIHAAHDGQVVRIRGRFDMHAHGVFLRDDACRGYMLTLKHVDGGPDITLCTPEHLVRVFGCPGGNDNGPVVTVVGILEPSAASWYGRLAVTEMRDFENARTGERVVP